MKTDSIVGDVWEWANRKWGEVNFYLTQLLSKHGHVNTYLNKLGIKSCPDCTYCPNKKGDVEHTFFQCDR